MRTFASIVPAWKRSIICRRQPGILGQHRKQRQADESGRITFLAKPLIPAIAPGTLGAFSKGKLYSSAPLGLNEVFSAAEPSF